MSTTKTDWLERVRALAPVLEAEAERHDREGSFVFPAYDALKKHRFFSMAVPSELGGGGASHPELCNAIRELARYCGSTALAFSMHSHLVAASVWRHRHGKPAEKLLRKVAAEQAVLVSTGASDWIDSNGTMERVKGGYRLSARKIFGSGGPAASMLIASAPYDDPDEGPQVLHFPVPTSAEGVSFASDWDTLGMRGTGSDTVVLDRVFIPDESIVLRRPRGQWHPAWSVVMTVAPPIYMAPYVGLAEAAASKALELAAGGAEVSRVVFQAGELENELAATRIAWQSMVENAANYDFAPELERANRAIVAKTLCARGAIATVEKAMELAGGRGYFRRLPLERLLRDVHAAPYHPLPEKRQHEFSGLIALGRDPITRERRA